MKNETFNQTRRDPKELAQTYKKRFVVFPIYYIVRWNLVLWNGCRLPDEKGNQLISKLTASAG